MNVSFNGDFNTTTTTNVASDSKPEGVVPVFIRQIKEMQEGHFKMWGMSFGMVTCVGIVREVDVVSTRINYVLEDHTGQIKAHLWLDEGDALKSPDIGINHYACVHGSIRQQEGSLVIMVIKISPVKSLNEITTHMLEVLNARYTAEHFLTKQSTSMQMDYETPVAAISATSAPSGLTGVPLAVYEAIKTRKEHPGMSVFELQQKFSRIDNLQSIIDMLSEEGHIYTTSDMNHYLVTE